jgi:hypothetical protein
VSARLSGRQPLGGAAFVAGGAVKPLAGTSWPLHARDPLDALRGASASLLCDASHGWPVPGSRVGVLVIPQAAVPEVARLRAELHREEAETRRFIEEGGSLRASYLV